MAASAAAGRVASGHAASCRKWRAFKAGPSHVGPSQRRRLLPPFGAYDKGDMASRVRWTSFVARSAEKLGWS